MKSTRKKPSLAPVKPVKDDAAQVATASRNVVVIENGKAKEVRS